MWNNLGIGECGEVVVVGFWDSLAEDLPAALEVANEFLLLCVYAKNGDALFCTDLPHLLYFLELRVSALHRPHGQILLEGTASVAEFVKYLLDDVSRCVNTSIAKLSQ